jgi:hypothetical protein
LKSDQDQCAGTTRSRQEERTLEGVAQRSRGIAGNLPADRPRDLVTHCIKRHIDAQRLNTLRIAEQSERELIEQFAGDTDPTPHGVVVSFFHRFQRDPR